MTNSNRKVDASSKASGVANRKAKLQGKKGRSVEDILNSNFLSWLYSVQDGIVQGEIDKDTAILRGWRKGWNNWGHRVKNGFTGHCYRGKNLSYISWLSMADGLEDEVFFTRSQVQHKKYGLKKRFPEAKWDKDLWIPIHKGRMFKVLDKDESKLQGKEVYEWRFRTFGYVPVTPASNITGVPKEVLEKFASPEPVGLTPEELQAQNSRANIVVEALTEGEAKLDLRFNKNKAFFSPDGNYVSMPKKWTTEEGWGNSFWTTLFHELIHWCPSRSKGTKNNWFGSPEYAREELVAEIGSALLCSRFGVELDLETILPNMRKYVGHWLTGAEADNTTLDKAYKEAYQRVEWITQAVFGYMRQQGYNAPTQVAEETPEAPETPETPEEKPEVEESLEEQLKKNIKEQNDLMMKALQSGDLEAMKVYQKMVLELTKKLAEVTSEVTA